MKIGQLQQTNLAIFYVSNTHLMLKLARFCGEKNILLVGKARVSEFLQNKSHILKFLINLSKGPSGCFVKDSQVQ